MDVYTKQVPEPLSLLVVEVELVALDEDEQGSVSLLAHRTVTRAHWRVCVARGDAAASLSRR